MDRKRDERQPSTTRLSSKGQVVIPEEIRERLGLQVGQRFVVIAQDDVIVLKRILHPTMDEFDGLIREARRRARSAGMTPADVRAAVAEARKRR